MPAAADQTPYGAPQTSLTGLGAKKRYRLRNIILQFLVAMVLFPRVLLPALPLAD